MRGYTNKDGLRIEVSQEHLNVAVGLYEELRKLSSSGKISWAKHRQMMVSEGFDDSDKNESYRQMIKVERKAQGLLPDVKTYASMLADDKIGALKREIGAMYHVKREIQQHANSLNRTKREVNDKILMTEMVRDTLANVKWPDVFDEVGVTNNIPASADIVSVSNLTDIHHGYLADNENCARDVTWGRLESYLDNLVAMGKRENVSHFIIVNLGDEIEGFLRNSSLMDSRTLAVEQIVEVSELIVKFLTRLKMSGDFKVSYLSIAGNHSRINPSKNDAMDKEDYTVIQKEIVKMACPSIGVEFIDTPEHYYHILNVHGYNIYLAHGDRDAVKSEKLLSDLTSLHNVILDIVMVGHWHFFQVQEVGNNKYQIITGSIKGSDKFSQKINKSSSRSQATILINETGFDIRQVMVDE